MKAQVKMKEVAIAKRERINETIEEIGQRKLSYCIFFSSST